MFEQDGAALALFLRYCEKTVREETFLCYQDIRRFKDPAKVEEARLEEQARSILDTYFRRGSRKEVNVSSEVLEPCRRDIKEGRFHRKVFDPILGEVSPLILTILTEFREKMGAQVYSALLEGRNAASPA